MSKRYPILENVCFFAYLQKILQFLFLQPSSVYDNISVFARCSFKSLLWLILLCISWSCLYCDSTVYCKKWCYDMLGEWWTFYRNPAANSFHLLSSCCLRLEALVFLPSQPRLSMCDILEKSLLLIQFSNHLHVTALLTLTCLSENSTHISVVFLKAKPCEFIVREAVWLDTSVACTH